jgi:DNA-binding transcriptional regulator YiaG
MDSYEQFFSWCEANGLTTDKQIADVFHVTPQTVRNWRRKRDAGGPAPVHLGYVRRGYAAVRGDGLQLPVVDFAWFQEWRDKHGLSTYEAVGDTFGVTRQAAHNWYTRAQLPKWIAAACAGYDIYLADLSEGDTSAGVKDSNDTPQ